MTTDEALDRLGRAGWLSPVEAEAVALVRQCLQEQDKEMEWVKAVNKELLPYQERAVAAEARVRELEDDDAVMRGYEAVSRMLMLRTGDKHDHAEAFRRALLADSEPQS